MRVAVIGIGNELLLDEGAGPACARYLAARWDLPECVEVLDRATMGMAVIADLRRADRALVLDAVDVPGAEPGTLFSFAPEDALGGQVMTSLHEMRFADVLTAARLLGVACEGHCLGVQAENIAPAEFACALTPRVAAAVPFLAAAAARWLERELGLAVRDRLAAGEIAAEELPLPAVAGEPDAEVQARYLEAGLAAVGACRVVRVEGGAPGGCAQAGARADAAGACASGARALGCAAADVCVDADEGPAFAPAAAGSRDVAFGLPNVTAAHDVAARFGLRERGPVDGVLNLVARAWPGMTDYDCDRIIGACRDVVRAHGQNASAKGEC